MNRAEERDAVIKGLTTMARHYGYVIEGKFVLGSLGSGLDEQELAGDDPIEVLWEESTQMYKRVSR